MYSDPVSSSELDDFVARAEQINAAVTGLAKGTLAAEDTNALLAELEREQKKKAPMDPALKALREEQAKKAEEERKRKGVKGQGARPGYLYFCRHCFLEYDLEPLPPAGSSSAAAAAPPAGKSASPVCTHCSQPLETREQRMADLMGKVAVLQARKAERAQRRAAYEAWKREKGSSVVVAGRSGATVEELPDDDSKQSQAAASSSASPAAAAAAAAAPSTSSSLSTRYSSWDFWEPSSDEEGAEVAEPDNPAFAAMKADIEAREAKKKLALAASEAANTRGNECVKKKDYLAAVDHYSTAIEQTRSEKSYYTNRALARLHVFDFEGAVKDAQTALDIHDCFEAEHTRYTSDFKNMKVVLKAHLRGSKAHLALGHFAEARKGIAAAAALVQRIYSASGRQDPAFAKQAKADYAEIDKLLGEVKEKEAFRKEEERVKEAQAAVVAATTTTDAAAAASTQVVPASSTDSATLSALLTSLTAAHQALLSSSSTASSSAPTPAASWSLLTPAVNFLCHVLEGEGNKERVMTHVESRLCVDVILKVIKHRASKSTAGTAAAEPLPPLPDFSPALALLAPSHPAHLSNGIWWRERDGFATLGKYLSQLFARIVAAGSSGGSVPADLLSVLLRVLTILTDRESAREYFASPSHAPVLTDLVVELLHAPVAEGYMGAPAALLGSMQLSASNLVANLAFQPKYRTWISASENEQRYLDKVYSGVMQQTKRVGWTNGSKDPSASSPSQSVALLAAGLSAVLNLLTYIGCRVRLVESNSSAAAPSVDASASDSASPLRLLLAALGSLTRAWAAQSYQVAPGSPLADLSDKVLSVVLNLSVDDMANATLFAQLLSTPAGKETLTHLLRLAARPAEESRATEEASEASTPSKLPPLLVERALGVLTRGLRREHNAATPPAGAVAGAAPAAAPASRPLRALLLQHDAPVILVRILALHRFASSEEAVTAESVLAKLDAPAEAEAEGSASAIAAASASSPPPFRYTRLTMEHASVCLAILMSHDATTSAAVASASWQGVSGLQMLVSLLSSPVRNLVGNACLCIDAIVTRVPALLSRPELSAALPRLLDVLKDPAAKAAHQNAAKAAIVLGRAPNNAEAWGQLRGLEIIAKVMAPSLLKKQ